MAVTAAPPDTTERNRSQAERLSRLEGGYEHLATKADVERILVAVERFRAEAQIENERARAEARADNERLRLENERAWAEAKADNERARAEAKADNERARAEARSENERLRTEFLAEIERIRAEAERNKADIIKVIISVAGIGAALMAAGFAFLRITGTG